MNFNDISLIEEDDIMISAILLDKYDLRFDGNCNKTRCDVPSLFTILNLS